MAAAGGLYDGGGYSLPLLTYQVINEIVDMILKWVRHIGMIGQTSTGYKQDKVILQEKICHRSLPL